MFIIIYFDFQNHHNYKKLILINLYILSYLGTIYKIKLNLDYV